MNPVIVTVATYKFFIDHSSTTSRQAGSKLKNSR